MISVVIATRNPDARRLQRTLTGLAGQTLSSSQWELLLVDNGSSPPLATRAWNAGAASPRIIREDAVGLTPARLAGIRAASGEVIVFVDDDNVLSPDYLAIMAARFDESPTLGIAGGMVVPEWEMPPPAWSGEFHGLLALRDFGPEPRIARGGAGAAWPVFAPVGAGLAVRRRHATAYAEAVGRDERRRALDRSAESLSSGGDCDLVFTTLHAGGDVAYVPTARVTHLIPAGRVDPRYLARLNRGIMRTWVAVLALHGQCPWKSIPAGTVPLRAARAWWRLAAWRRPVNRIRWFGALGQFEGQADIRRWAKPPSA